MAILSRKVDYALLILSFLARQPEGASARVIADRFGLNRGFVANILKGLCSKGFVSSHRGVKGGYVLARPAHEVALSELIDALDDSFRLAECTGNHPPEHECSLTGTCPVQSAVTRVHQRLRAVLSDVTLADLFDTPGMGDRTVTMTQLGLPAAARPAALIDPVI